MCSPFSAVSGLVAEEDGLSGPEDEDWFRRNRSWGRSQCRNTDRTGAAPQVVGERIVGRVYGELGRIVSG